MSSLLETSTRSIPRSGLLCWSYSVNPTRSLCVSVYDHICRCYNLNRMELSAILKLTLDPNHQEVHPQRSARLFCYNIPQSWSRSTVPIKTYLKTVRRMHRALPFNSPFAFSTTCRSISATKFSSKLSRIDDNRSCT